MPSHYNVFGITRLEAVADAMLTALKRCEQSDIAMGVVYAKSVDREARLRKAIEDAREVLKNMPHEEGCVTQGRNPKGESCNCFRQYPYALLKKWDET